MKTMTCRQLGGPCEQRLSADSWDEMVKAMTNTSWSGPRYGERDGKDAQRGSEETGPRNETEWDATLKPELHGGDEHSGHIEHGDRSTGLRIG